MPSLPAVVAHDSKSYQTRCPHVQITRSHSVVRTTARPLLEAKEILRQSESKMDSSKGKRHSRLATSMMLFSNNLGREKNCSNSFSRTPFRKKITISINSRSRWIQKTISQFWYNCLKTILGKIQTECCLRIMSSRPPPSLKTRSSTAIPFVSQAQNFFKHALLYIG